MMKTVLLYANDDKGMESRLQAALDMARAFDAHITCVQVTPYDSFIMGDAFGGVYAMPTVIEQVREKEDAHRARVESRLNNEGVGWDWLRYDGSPAQVLFDRARLADLVVLNLASDPDHEGPASLVADVALNVRAPVLALPTASRAIDLFGPAMLAWDGAVEAANALRLSLSLLRQASEIHVVTVTDDVVAFPATDAALYLSRHGIEPVLHQWPREGRGTAAALIDAATTLNVGYVVMGAYGHSRLREALLGGATREMLRSSPLPLVLAH
jgi:nucleotide-binding universal stress UspA family protein